MATVALFCLSRSLAHAGRTLAAARVLADAGHRAVLHGAPGQLEALVEDDEPVVVVDEPSLDAVLASARGRRVPVPPAQALPALIAADRAALRACQAELVVVDNRRSAGLAAESLGLPWISLTGGLLLGPHSAVAPPAAAVARVVGPVVGVPADHMRRTGRLAQLADTDPVAPQARPLPPALAQALAAAGARPRRHVHELCLGDRTLVLDAPALLPTRDLPPGVVQPGPWLVGMGTAPPLAAPRGPRVWLTAGATGDPSLVPRLAQGLVRWGVEVVVSGAGAAAAAGPGVRVLPLIQLDTLLPTVDLVICHGGAGTVHHARAHGCRVLALPTHLEQAMVGLALEATGTGRTIAAPTARLLPAAALGMATALLSSPAPPPLAVDRMAAPRALTAAVDALLSPSPRALPASPSPRTAP